MPFLSLYLLVSTEVKVNSRAAVNWKVVERSRWEMQRRLLSEEIQSFAKRERAKATIFLTEVVVSSSLFDKKSRENSRLFTFLHHLYIA